MDKANTPFPRTLEGRKQDERRKAAWERARQVEGAADVVGAHALPQVTTISFENDEAREKFCALLAAAPGGGAGSFNTAGDYVVPTNLPPTQPVTRLQLANLGVMQLLMASHAREVRDYSRALARELRRISKPASRAAALLSSGAPSGMSASPDTPSGHEAFHAAVRVALNAIKQAEALAPQTSRPEWEPDEVDRAPTHNRLHAEAAKALVQMGLPVSGAALRDILEGQGIRVQEEQEGARRQAGKVGMRARRAVARTMDGLRSVKQSGDGGGRGGGAKSARDFRHSDAPTDKAARGKTRRKAQSNQARPPSKSPPRNNRNRRAKRRR